MDFRSWRPSRRVAVGALGLSLLLYMQMAKLRRKDIWRALWRAGMAAALILVFVRCDLTDPVDRHSLVVEAFVETGDSLPTITLRETQALNDGSDGAASVASGAVIELVVDGKTVSYEPSPDRPGRYLPESPGGVVQPRVPWQLRVRWKTEVARASGITPPPIDLREMCIQVPEAPVEAILVDSLRRDSLDIPAEEGYIYPVDVSLRWSRTRFASHSDTIHWVRPRVRPDTAESSSRVVNFFLEPVEVRREDQFPVRGGDRYWEGVYAIPVEDSTSAFPRHRLTATLVRGDTSFAAFARSRNDPERREPISNVAGGLGIATAIAMDSLQRRVEPGLNQCYSQRTQ